MALTRVPVLVLVGPRQNAVATASQAARNVRELPAIQGAGRVDRDLRRVGPEFAAAQLARMLSAPTELLGPIVRRTCGRRGVALGPALTAQTNAVAAACLVRLMRGRRRSPVDRWLILTATAWCLATPALSVLSERAVVLRDRSPLWGYGVQGLLTIPVSLGIANGVIATGRAARGEHRRSTVAEPS